MKAIDVYQFGDLNVHLLPGYIQRIFLVEDHNKLMLLDGCSRADVERVCGYITDTLKRPLSDLKLIVVTHMHPDHGGGAHKLRHLTGAPIASHPKARHWYGGFSGRASHLIDVLLAQWVAGRMGKARRNIWYNPILKPDLILLDEQTLPGFEDWQAIYTPGHTNHDLSLIHTPSRQIYVADLMVLVKGDIVPPYPVCHPNQYKQALKRIQSLRPERVFYAHVPALAFDKVPFEQVLSQAPRLPKNNWQSSKVRIARMLGLRLQSQ